MKVHLLVIGDELLIGQITDTNSGFLGQLFTQNGYTVSGKSAVGDQANAIREELADRLPTADLIVLTGGLGPTKDDVTKKTLAEFFDSELVFHQETYDRIEAYFNKIGRAMPPAMRDQATVPVKAEILPNKVGSAPGMWFETTDHKIVVSLPGVPWEMEYLSTHEVLPRLQARFPGSPIAHRTVLTAGEGESNVARRIASFENDLPEHVKLAYLPSLGQVRLRLSGAYTGLRTPERQAELEAEVERLRDEMIDLIPDLVYGTEEQSLQAAVGELLLQQGKKLATAESCTGGHVAALITSVPGSSAYFPGSVVTYSYEMKEKLLGVRPETLQTFGAVSAETVREMVSGALPLLEADVAVAISGIAGPDGGTADKPVGTVWMAVGDRERTIVQKHLFGRDRVKNIQLTGVYALNLVRRFLLGEG
ncbi:MAG: CinA family nicotinamide mononucleotide deamidase-related protein [Saprospiraceae bacterium]|nr:CinA family nicotinamide mononucleotide deamidase-related protein [Saprospiraceae bacterium]